MSTFDDGIGASSPIPPAGESTPPPVASAAPVTPPAAAPPPGWPAPAGPPAGGPHMQPPPPGQQMQPPPGPPMQAPPQPPPGPQVVQTDEQAKDGLSKCARCGATDIALNIETGNLRCNFCRFEQPSPNALRTYHLDGDPRLLQGVVVGSGSSDIIPSTAEVLTFKCSACGAEVVIDTKSSMQARCHWCRNTLSMNQQIPNGAVPDMILPFRLPKQDAVQRINAFVKKRAAFAHPRFKAEFNAENVVGVYLPYMVVDVNAQVQLSGEGEHQTRSYTIKEGDKEVRVYDADVYHVGRTFDLYVDDLTLESSSERLDQNASRNTNNIINSIMPFDVENSVCYDSNYLSGFASEKRDSNIEALAPMVVTQTQDIARFHANSTLQFYDRGVRWDNEQIAVAGQRWVSAYLPVWLYSYYEKKSNGSSFVHYVAVNGRTGETMGSVPINHLRLLLASLAVEIVGVILFLIVFLVGG